MGGVDCWVDSCATGPCQADASCANAACSNNADGSQSCACNDGYKGEGYECTNIAGERAANIIARAAEFADTAAADLVNDTRALNRVNKALGQYETIIEYVRTW